MSSPAVPSRAEPPHAALAQALPSQVLPSQGAPSQLEPTYAAPSLTLPFGAVLSDAVIARDRSAPLDSPIAGAAAMSTPGPSGPSPVLTVTADPVLADQVRRLAAAAGVEIALCEEAPTASRWVGARLVVVGADLARQLIARGLPRRPDLVLVTPDSDDAEVWQSAVALGAEQVAVLPDAQTWLVERLAAGLEPPGQAHVVAVMGGCGGAGASVLTAALAVTAARSGLRVLAADLDPLGGGLDLVLGVDDAPGLRWPDLISARGRLPSFSVHDALPRLDGLAVLAWGRGASVDVPAAAVDAVLGSAARAHDLVVVDLPRAGDDTPVVTALRGVSELLVVVPARVRAVAAAAQVVDRWFGAVPRVGVVVRRAAGERISARAVADAVQLPLRLQMRDEPRLDHGLDRGDPPGLRQHSPLRRACEQWLADSGLTAPDKAA